jgi:hypothetical protein
LFSTILTAVPEIGWDAAWAHLEQCVIEKRLSWLDAHMDNLRRTDNPLNDGFRAFYEVYLRLSCPHDGEIVEASADRLVTRWWNACPTLEACRNLSLDTRDICRRVYHRPVQLFLARIDPRLRFDRNYATLRPYGPCCEEIISQAVSGCV